MPTNSNDGPSGITYRGTTHQTTEQHKFGKGSVLITEKTSPHGYNLGGFSGPASEIPGDIRKLTITAWVRPVDGKPFVIFSRFPPAIPASTPGSLEFVYSSAYKCFWFEFFQADKTRPAFRSKKINFIEPDEWLHIAVTFDEGKVVFYMNGLPIGDADASSTTQSIYAAQEGQILGGFVDARPGTYVDDFGIFADRALNPEEIDQIYHNGLKEFLKESSAASPQ